MKHISPYRVTMGSISFQAISFQRSSDNFNFFCSSRIQCCACFCLLQLLCVTQRGGSRNFGKGGPGKGVKPRTERRRRERRRGVWGLPPENFEKFDAISCNLAYIFGIRMASDIIQNWAFAKQKTVAATSSIHTHTHTPPHFQKLLGFRPL